MLVYDIFFRRHGVRLPQHLMTPVISTLDKFQFPRNSLYNHLTLDGVTSGPSSDDYLFRTVTKQILMDHVVELSDYKGTPKRIGKQVVPYIKEYHSKNRRFRFAREMVVTPRDETVLMVLNYDFIAKLYRYTRSFYSEYYKWWNIEKTLWKNADQTASISNRNQFVFSNLPKILPSISSLNNSSKTVNASTIRFFNSYESLFILEIWKWLSAEYRQESTLSDIKSENLSKINIVFQESNNWVVVNLGVLNSWRTTAGEASGVLQKVNISSPDLQKRFLRMLMSLMNTRITPIETVDITEEVKPEGEFEDTEEEHVLDEETRLEKANRTLETMDDDLKELETIEKKAVPELNETKVVIKAGKVDIQDFHTEISNEGSIVTICDKLADDGLLTAATYRNLVTSAQNYKTIKAPSGEGTLEEFIKINPEDIVIKESPSIRDIPTVIDKSMLQSSLMTFDEDYVNKILAKDVAGMVVNIQKAGVILSNYTVDKTEDILGNHETHTIRVRPVEGVSTTLRFKLPTVDKDGIVTYNGNRYRLRKQRGDMPIRKIAPDTVALTSYYGKTFIRRNTKRTNNYAQWLRNTVMAMGLDASDNEVTDLATSDVFDNSFNCPRVYSTLAMVFKSFISNGYKFNFEHTKREAIFGKEAMTKYEIDNRILLASNETGNFLVVDQEDSIYETNGNDEPLLKGTIESLLKIDQNSSPVEFSEINVYGKSISIGFVLAYQLGLNNLLTLLKVEPRRVPAGQRVNLEGHEYAIVFNDISLVFNKEDKLATMILAGFSEYDKAIRKYPVITMDKPNVYLNILETVGLNARYLREIDLMNNLFIDPITRELLIEMNEPTTVRGLLVRSSELLLLDKHPDQLDLRFMRIKGYERLAGAVYSELVQSIRAHGSSSGRAKNPLQMKPYAVWQRVVQDPSMSMVSDINPINNLKEMEAVTYSGTGGRSSRSMVKGTREYHVSDTGVISESTPDSSTVGVNIFTSADPQFKSLRGTKRDNGAFKLTPTSILSTSALISPGSDHDNPMRVNFVGIQHSHGLACSGYKQSSVRTGYEQILAHRTTDMFAHTARKDGVIVSKNNAGIQIKYDDGTTSGHPIGRRFGTAAGGLVIPHDLSCDLNVGDTFKTGDVICYNNGFFERDLLDPKQVVWKVGVTAKTVLYESSQTLEDASSISKSLAEKLTTMTTKVKTIVVNFDQIVRNIVKPGDKLEPESILCTIEEAVTGGSNLFDEESLNTLRLLSNQTPTSKVRGVVERIEVFYHGDKEMMSDTLKAIASIYDKELSSRNKSIGGGSISGSVNNDLRIDGDPLLRETFAIRFYITSNVPAGVGDKGVFANQMKTVFSEVLHKEMRTEAGEVIDAVFGAKSIADRIVLSPYIIGTTNTLLDIIGKRAAKIYKRT